MLTVSKHEEQSARARSTRRSLGSKVSLASSLSSESLSVRVTLVLLWEPSEGGEDHIGARVGREEEGPTPTGLRGLRGALAGRVGKAVSC